jgi:hypothetical protein
MSGYVEPGHWPRCSLTVVFARTRAHVLVVRMVCALSLRANADAASRVPGNGHGLLKPKLIHTYNPQFFTLIFDD